MSTAAAVMTTQEVANRLSQLFKENNWAQVQEELFSDDAKSIEPPGVPGLQTVQGLDNIRKKGEQFNAMVEEVHGGWASEPIVAGCFISVAMGLDATMKGMGRINMDEIVVYEVKNGKIISEQFFFHPQQG